MKNYESIGRYVDAVETVEECASERNQLLRKLRELIEKTTADPTNGYAANAFDAVKALDLLNRAAERDAAMREAVAEANGQAEICRRSRIYVDGLRE